MPPNTKKCEQEGTTIPCSKDCPATNPTPAVEDWEEKAWNFIAARCNDGVAVDQIIDFIRSLRESDRKRCVEGLEKMRKDRTFTNFLRHDIADQCLGYYNQAISDAITFITNLK